MTITEPVQSQTKYTGARIRRTEDPRLLAGRGQYIDDVTVPKMLQAAVLRSPHPHARITGIDTSRARALPGVFDVITGQDLAAVADQQPVIWFPIPEQRIARTHALAVDRVRWVGQAVAAVVATDRYVAEDALELIEVSYELLPVVADLDAALAPDAPKLYDDWPDNVSGSLTYRNGDADEAFASADLVVGGSFSHGRAFGCPLEPRGCIVNWDSFEGTLDVWLSTQSPNLARDLLAEVFDVPVHKIRVRTPHIGGGFGNKFDFYGEEVIAAVLSRRTGRPVKLLEDRAESFVATGHSRDQRLDFEMALSQDGTILGLRGTSYGVLGGALGTVGSGPPWASVLTSMGPYKIPNLELHLKAVVTNRAPYGSYRGWGAPKGNLVHERLIEMAARELGMDRAEIRRKNFPAPEEFPYFTGAIFTYDSGRYADCLDLAMSKVDELGWRERQAEARAEGRHVGIGYSFHIEPSGYGPSRILNLAGLAHSGFDEAVVRMDSGGKVTIYTGQINIGQGTHTIYSQLAADTLGVPMDDVVVVTGDTDSCPYTGYGTGGSRAATLGGAAILRASERLRGKVFRVAAQLLEASPDDLQIDSGTISVRGTSGPSVTTRDVGDAAYRRLLDRLPDDEMPTLEEVDVFDPVNMATSFGCAALLIEVDPETGTVSMLDCLQAHDCGTVINPMLVDGQLAGGLAQAMGGALLEELVYDEEARLRTGSFRDYLLPTATDIPPFHFYHQETPAPDIPGGMKGVGEAGTIAGVSLVASAIDDALTEFGVTVTRFPVTPPRLLEQIREATSHKEGSQ
ncbi:MAG: Carbon-monoxide dehydrogenase (acceptor) [Pseudonocardia sp.]|jgi:carbon-monoxide dehydrogenase large subunit|uniref:xanthine dehydrogenase family protein molybdopterin-binding subunit n=1 Tax=Pseudonocardia sp. TaxID=60912 RepID=UPI00260C13F6|nr:xanthine dehydrogenase family protein molybdopterin-binding subunit [Pseudonocardia sp.]MCU1630997.1 Carbon-monoxide dehydrogenase (acceptor) [Pseudonocardia sp.]MDT7700034.1 aerobic carbon-monoxide dehydrogenase large subunit [Pseudonocardiales bacterium]